MVKRISINKTLLRNIIDGKYEQCEPKQKRNELRNYGTQGEVIASKTLFTKIFKSRFEHWIS